MNTNNNKQTCEAIKKDGAKCSFKSKCGSKYCGVHKNYIPPTPPQQIIIRFFDGSTIEVNKGIKWYEVGHIIQEGRKDIVNIMTEQYKYFEEGVEEPIRMFNRVEDKVYFCLIQTKTFHEYEEGNIIHRYRKDDGNTWNIDGGNTDPSKYVYVKNPIDDGNIVIGDDKPETYDILDQIEIKILEKGHPNSCRAGTNVKGVYEVKTYKIDEGGVNLINEYTYDTSIYTALDQAAYIQYEMGSNNYHNAPRMPSSLEFKLFD